jgi:threonine/homoserine/homoserine lactone efflux protein
MAGVDSLTPGRATAIGFALSALNPKNLLLTVGAAAGLAQLGLPRGDAAVAEVVFLVVASSTVAAAVGYELLGGRRARRSLAEVKAWLVPNSAAVMAVLLVVFGDVLVAKGIGLLTA